MAPKDVDIVYINPLAVLVRTSIEVPVMLFITDSPFFALLSGLFMLIVCVYYSSQERRRGQALPGPPALPIIGHLLDFPKSRPWLAYHQMCQKYGEYHLIVCIIIISNPVFFAGGLVSLRALGRTLVVIDDYDTAVDLLEKRSAVYSSRPDFKMARLWDTHFASTVIRAHIAPQDRLGVESRFCALRLRLEEHPPSVLAALPPRCRRPISGPPGRCGPEDAIRPSRDSGEPQGAFAIVSSMTICTFLSPLNKWLSSLGVSILSSTYGLEIVDSDDENLSVCEEALHSVELLMFNTYLVEYFPWLARVPPWVPGAGYLRRIAEFHDAAWKLRNMPWEHAKAALVSCRT